MLAGAMLFIAAAANALWGIAAIYGPRVHGFEER